MNGIAGILDLGAPSVQTGAELASAGGPAAGGRFMARGSGVPGIHRCNDTGRVLVADARIDNRRELASQLGLDRASDAEVILRAYARWGPDCAERLLGDFAFVIWDAARATLFCARDPMGVRPFYYHRAETRLAFASDLRTLLGIPGVPAAADAQRITEFVLNVDPGRERTFYAGIRRLPAAHTLQVRAAGDALRCYWRPDPDTEIRFARDEDYAEAFRERFDQAVRNRIRADEHVATSLSGGLDSSSIACVAGSIRDGAPATLRTISLVFPGVGGDELRLIDERHHMASVTRHTGIRGLHVLGDRTSPLRDVHRIVRLLQEPYGTPNLYLHWAMYAAAARDGAGVFLDGFDGDSAVGHGLARLDALLATGDRHTYDAEVRTFAGRRGIDPSRVVRAYGLPRLRRLAYEGRWREWAREAWQHHRAYGFSRRELVTRYGIAASRVGTSLGRRPRTVAERLARCGAPRPKRHESVAPASPREDHVRGLMQPAYQSALEVAHHCAGAFGLDARFPFFDRRLVEFCIALPAQQQFRDGWTRLVLRRAMAGLVPDQVRLRPDKGNLAPAFHRGLRDDDVDVLNGLDLRTLEPFVDVDLFARMRQAYSEGSGAVQGAVDPLALFRIATLAVWLEEHERGTLAQARAGWEMKSRSGFHAMAAAG